MLSQFFCLGNLRGEVEASDLSAPACDQELTDQGLSILNDFMQLFAKQEEKIIDLQEAVHEISEELRQKNALLRECRLLPLSDPACREEDDGGEAEAETESG